jgi:hypothetical protein
MNIMIIEQVIVIIITRLAVVPPLTRLNRCIRIGLLAQSKPSLESVSSSSMIISNPPSSVVHALRWEKKNRSAVTVVTRQTSSKGTPLTSATLRRTRLK